MTLDEAIRHCEEVAKEKEQMAFDLATTFNRETINSKECKKCANEHRQLAEWLKDYKRLLKEQELYENRVVGWKKDFKGFIRELSMPKDDYNGIMQYIDEVSIDKMY